MTDTDLTEIRQGLLNGKWNTLKNKAFLLVKGELAAVGNLVLRGIRIVIPTSFREQVLRIAHEGHPGIVAMKQRLRNKVC